VTTTSSIPQTEGDRIEPAEFFAQALAAFERAVERCGCQERHIRLAGHVIRLRFAGDALVPTIMRALAHIEVPCPAQHPALVVALFDTESTGEAMPPPAWGPNDWGAKGEIAGFNDDRIRTVFPRDSDILQLYDADRPAAIYWVRAARKVPWWDAPLRTTLHWWATPTTLQPTHAGAVAREGVGALVAGESGAGKSTTTLACLAAGFDYLGDDYVMVDVDEPSVHSMYSTAKLEPQNLARFPTLGPLVANPSDLDQPKAVLFLNEHVPNRLCAGASVRAVVMPRITGERASRLAPAPASQALASVAPTVLFQLPGFGRQALSKLSRLVRGVPCYWLDAGEDVRGIAEALDDLLDDLR
jgi:hypothetical protein